jgi:hypothetical protein
MVAMAIEDEKTRVASIAIDHPPEQNGFEEPSKQKNGAD